MTMIQYRGAVYQEVNAGAWDKVKGLFGKKPVAKPEKPEQKSDTKHMSAPPRQKDQDTVVEQKSDTQTKTVTFARNSYMDLAMFFQPLLGEEGSAARASVNQYIKMFEPDVAKQDRIKLVTNFLTTFGNYIKYVQKYKTDTRPGKKEVYEAYEKKFGGKDPLAPVVKYLDALKAS